MHKAVRIKIFQQMPNYRKPSSFLIKETYPLPPYSSVIGMIHAVCGFEKGTYHPMKVSIQGTSGGAVSDYAVMYMFAPESTIYDADKETGGKKLRGILVKGYGDIKDTGLNRSPKCVELLTDVHLVIHIIPDDESELEKIAESFMNPPEYISLGRREDIARIDDVSIVELCDEPDDYAILKYDAYVPVKYMEDVSGDEIRGTIYKLSKVFDTSDKSGIRTWKEVVQARHMPKDCGIDEEAFENEYAMYDSEINTPVFFA
ncbi:MAG: type I-B CRISPR-associated protein Cas5b [Oscillospiraceae bacterium]